MNAWRYCPMCDALVRGDECPKCGGDTDKIHRARQLTRQEQLEALADRGIDTWADFREER